MIPRKTPIKRQSRIKNVNRRRKASEWKRAYHSVARVKFVQGLPCIACGFPESENAHIVGGGASRKADADQIVPLCGPRFDHPGCHDILHRLQPEEFQRVYGVDLAACAAETEKAWLASDHARPRSMTAPRERWERP